MKSHKAVSLLFSVVVAGACASPGSSAWAGEGSLMFHGSLVYAGCNGQVLNASAPVGHVKTLQAGPDVVVGLMPGNDACRTLVAPLRASYTRLYASQPDAQAGVVTLTYD